MQYWPGVEVILKCAQQIDSCVPHHNHTYLPATPRKVIFHRTTAPKFGRQAPDKMTEVVDVGELYPRAVTCTQCHSPPNNPRGLTFEAAGGSEALWLTVVLRLHLEQPGHSYQI